MVKKTILEFIQKWLIIGTGLNLKLLSNATTIYLQVKMSCVVSRKFCPVCVCHVCCHWGQDANRHDLTTLPLDVRKRQASFHIKKHFDEVFCWPWTYKKLSSPQRFTIAAVSLMTSLFTFLSLLYASQFSIIQQFK